MSVAISPKWPIYHFANEAARFREMTGRDTIDFARAKETTVEANHYVRDFYTTSGPDGTVTVNVSEIDGMGVYAGDEESTVLVMRSGERILISPPLNQAYDMLTNLEYMKFSGLIPHA